MTPTEKLPRRAIANGGAALAAGIVVGGPLVTAGFGGAVGDEREAPPPPPPPPVEQTVPRWEYERVQRKSWRRLMGWRKAERQRERLKRSMRWRVDFVAAGLRCIHELEGSWRAATGNGYFGGLQMDASFQRTYGAPLVQRYGSANRWPPEAQIAVGTVAYYSGRGFGPWPNTRRGCGL